jgi:hypothetical protein
VVALAGTACGASLAQEAFSRDFQCPERRVKVEELDDTRYRASGCEEEAIYICFDECKLSRQRPVEAVSKPRYVVPDDPNFATLTSADDGSLVSLDVKLDPRVMLKLRASPSQHGELAQLKLQRLELDAKLSECALDVLVNGSRVSLPVASKSHDKGKSSLVVNLPRDLVRDFGMAEQFAIRACSTRWSFTREQIAALRGFVARYEEELSWAGDAKQSGGGMLAPHGGWPEWKSLGAAPAADTTAPALPPAEVFKEVAQSVVRVEGKKAAGVSQGSGVSVSTTSVATNCHVLEGAQKIVVKQDKREWPARVSSSKPKQDRCIVSIDEPALVPIRGVRRYASLVVGEPLYSVGAPSGLDLSLSDGLLSGLRQESDVRFVQTTTPISPGSSGGPLFDGRGNLVGITTLVLLGKDRLNQALNFAIAADAYWDP